MLRVRCQATATLDAKGRLALPAVLRRALDKHDVTSLVVTFHGGSLWGWTPEVFEQTIEGPISEQDPFDPAVAQFSHAIERQPSAGAPASLDARHGKSREQVSHVVLFTVLKGVLGSSPCI